MKKVFLSAVAIMAFGLASAQKSIRFGVKGGLNVSTLNGDYYDNSKPKVGAHVGGLVDIEITKRFSVQPELLLSLQGTKFDRYYGNNVYSEDRLNLTYLNIPVMAKFYVLPQLSLEAGPQIGFLVAANDKVINTRNFNNGNSQVVTRDSNVKGDFSTVEAAFNIGASYYFTDNLFVTARYSFGISSIDDRSFNNNNFNDDDYNYYYNNAYDTYNGTFQASVGYRF